MIELIDISTEEILVMVKDTESALRWAENNGYIAETACDNRIYLQKEA